MLSSEFMILYGARALAVPLKLGQSLERVSKKKADTLHWKAVFGEDTWFEAVLNLPGFGILETTSEEIAAGLVQLLKKVVELSPGFEGQLKTYDVVTRLEFNPAFGFGSSSTLTSLLANWSATDPLQLHFSISRGSGYDVACAEANSPLLYQLINEMPVIQSVDFQPEFSRNLWFVYLGEKQKTGESVAAFLTNYKAVAGDIDYFTALTQKFVHAHDLAEFGEVMEEHEARLSEVLKIPTLKTQRFEDLEGYAKSLGAWGGDFALIATPWDRETLEGYLSGKGYKKWFAYNELAL